MPKSTCPAATAGRVGVAGDATGATEELEAGLPGFWIVTETDSPFFKAVSLAIVGDAEDGESATEVAGADVVTPALPRMKSVGFTMP